VSHALAPLEALAQRLPQAFVLFDFESRARLVSAAFERMLTIPQGTLSGCTLREVLERIATQVADPDATLARLEAMTRPEQDIVREVTLTTGNLAYSPLNASVLLPESGAAADGGGLVLLLETPARSIPTVGQGQADTAALLTKGLAAPAANLASTARRLLEATQRADAQHQLARILARSAETLTDAFSALAQLAELGDRAVLRLAPVELGDVLMTVIPAWKARAPRHSLELALPGEVPAILADERRVQLVFHAMIECAVKLAPAGGPVRVTVRPGEDQVTVSVRHFGAPLPADELLSLFEPFHQPSTAPDAFIQGGLGLPLARTIVTAHGGRLWAETPDAGSGVAVLAAWPHVPPAAAPVSITALETAPPPPAAPRIAVTRPREVALVIQGEPRMARYLRANLQAQHYRALAVETFDEGLHTIDREEPDLVLLDGGVADVALDEALEHLRTYAGAPVLVLARRHDALECARALDLGAADYLAQPFSMEELLARLRVALRARRATAEEQAREPLFQSGGLTIDFEQRQVAVDGRTVSLSKTEFKLLRQLARHAGMVLSHETLLEHVWGSQYGREVEFVWVYIRRLRRKIEPDPAKPRYILTVPGVGYRLARG
jgi:DNA-binding response OmpR family regulator/signal transduction histidine kinase